MNVCNGGSAVTVFTDLPANGRQARREAPDAEWLDYCRARERAERAAAKNARSGHARRAHQELAQAYQRIIVRGASA